MISLKPQAGLGPNFVSKTARLEQLGAIQFAVVGLTAGQVTFQYSVDGGANWFALDATNLVFSEDGTRVASWGGCEVRAIGDGAIAGGNLDVLINGPYVV
ncbi:MAG: hypothetical protein AAGB04_00100 [Pseudomonadota bacterium]